MDSDPAVHLRAVELRDLDFTRRWRNDPGVSVPALGRPFPTTEADERHWFETLGAPIPAAVTWVVADRDDEPLGLTSLRRIDWVHRTAALGIWLAPHARGRGVGRAATALTLDHGFGRFNLRKISLEVTATNAAALAVYRSLGFTEEGRFVDEVWLDGAYADVLRLAITPAARLPPPSS